MTFKIILIHFTIISVHWISLLAFSDQVDSLRTVGYGIPEKPLNPPPPPVDRSSSTDNDADYVIEEYPSETPVKLKPIESPDREPIYVEPKEQDKSSPEAVNTRKTFNNVRPPVPAIPSAVIDPPLGGYEDPRDAVANREPVKRPVGNDRYPNPNIDAHLSDGCKCVPYFQCDEDGYMITNGGGIIDPRFSIPQHPKTSSYLSVSMKNRLNY